ncbi:MAG: hypothetical protein HC852_24190 [Acaryochloridaceae cyanobacterium RU_4_10]|nr:hypothetical protein [Acaryochloridaceae cyanobacterium RU_4_10]
MTKISPPDWLAEVVLRNRVEFHATTFDPMHFYLAFSGFVASVDFLRPRCFKFLVRSLPLLAV